MTANDPKRPIRPKAPAVYASAMKRKPRAPEHHLRGSGEFAAFTHSLGYLTNKSEGLRIQRHRRFWAHSCFGNNRFIGAPDDVSISLWKALYVCSLIEKPQHYFFRHFRIVFTSF